MTEVRKNYRLVKLVLQSRVVRKLCIDCGAFIGGRAGYCHSKICGRIENPIVISEEEKAEAEKLMEEQDRGYVQLGDNDMV